MQLNRSLLTKLLSGSLFVCCFGVGNQAIAQYTVVDLGDLGGGNAWGWAVTNYSTYYGGVVAVGRSNNLAGQTRGFRAIADGTPTIASTGHLGGQESQAFGVIERIGGGGNIDTVGMSKNLSGYQRAVIWPNSSASVDVGSLGGNESAAHDINKYGWIVGRGQDMSGNYQIMYVSKFPTLTKYNCGTIGGTYGAANSMNNRGSATVPGDLVGDSTDVAGVSKAFVVYIGVAGTCTPLILGSLAGANGASLGRSINDDRLAVGMSEVNATTWHAVKWVNPTVSSIAPVDLGTLGGTNSYALDVNNDDFIVGTAQDSTGVYHAFIYDATNGMVDLNTLIGSGTGWVLTHAMGINDEGYIVGRGQLNGVDKAFLLEP